MFDEVNDGSILRQGASLATNDLPLGITLAAEQQTIAQAI
jgi:hypothetical protein